MNFPDIYQNPPLPLPAGVSEARLLEWLSSVRVDGGGDEIENYLRSDFRRFVYTFGLAANAKTCGNKALEFGANPYFATWMLRQFTGFDWSYSNYFGSQLANGLQDQTVRYTDFASGEPVTEVLKYHHFNSETDPFPFSDGTFSLVLYCEIIEHLLNDPCKVLRSISDLLAPGGQLVLTTPNVARIENVLRLIDGVNMYDPYSGYGPYGRHNREYTCAELGRLLTYMGFEIEEMFTADVHLLAYRGTTSADTLKSLVGVRSDDLGQYIFMRARKASIPGMKKPGWLYRSLPPAIIETRDDAKVGNYDAKISRTDTNMMSLGQRSAHQFRLKNMGLSAWDLDAAVFGARAYAPDGTVVREFRGTPIAWTASGKERQVTIDLDLVGLPCERVEIVFDIVNEHKFWFADVGSQALRVVLG
ncbi:hypothetical protein BH11PSE7_BH11PSE7_28770 [soil metagenome]